MTGSDSNPPLITGKKIRRKMRQRLKQIAKDFSTKHVQTIMIIGYCIGDIAQDGVLDGSLIASLGFM